MKKTLFLTLFAALFAVAAFAQTAVLNSGTQIQVRTDQAINATSANVGKSFTATVSHDVVDQNGNVAIPAGTPARISIVNAGNGSDVTVDLRSVEVNGRRVNLASETQTSASNAEQQGIGKNKRTGEYVGGGALAGTIIGAIAGGAKGAAIGMITGGAAGAGAQVLTKGKNVNIPAETQLTFQLANNVTVPYNANGYPSRRRLPPPNSDNPNYANPNNDQYNPNYNDRDRDNDRHNPNYNNQNPPTYNQQTPPPPPSNSTTPPPQF